MMKVKKYRKKPVEVEAIQWTGNNSSDIKEFAGDNCNIDIYDEALDNSGKSVNLVIHTLEGSMRAHIGDYILKGIKGEFYPCRKDIFESTYEEC